MAFLERSGQRNTAQSDVSASYKERGWKVSQSSLSQWLDKEQNRRDAVAYNPAYADNKKVPDNIKNPRVEEALQTWVQQQQERGGPLTENIVRDKYREFAIKARVAEADIPSLSGGWIASFKKRAGGLRRVNLQGEAAAVSVEDAEKEMRRVAEINKLYKLCDIYIADETGAFWKLIPKSWLAKAAKGKQVRGYKERKSRVTLMLGVNADGSHKLQPLVIGKSHQPTAFRKKPAGYYGLWYIQQKKARMDQYVFKTWIERLNSQMRREKRHIILWLDNFSGHKSSGTLSNVRIEFYRPNLTSYVQPCDQGIIANVKAIYRKQFLKRATLRFDSKLYDADKCFDLDLLEALRMIMKAWDMVTPLTVANCYRKSGNLPGDVDAEGEEDEDVNIDEEVAEIAERLELSVEEISQSAEMLHSLDEHNAGTEELTDDQILAAASGERAEEDEGSETEAETQPTPTYNEAVAAADVLMRFADVSDLEEAAEARQALVDFLTAQRRRRDRTAVQSTISSFFAPSGHAPEVH